MARRRNRAWTRALAPRMPSVALLAALSLLGCDEEPDPSDGSVPTDASVPGVDSGPRPDGGPAADGGPPGMPPSGGPVLELPTAITSYYVSSSLGDDAWSGTLPEPNGAGTDGPKATVGAIAERLNAASPGTHVLLRRGDEWSVTSTLEIGGATGTPEAPVVLGAYGDGAQPRLVGGSTGNVIIVRGNRDGASSHFWLRDLFLTAQSPADGQVAVYIGESFHPEVPHHITFSQLTIEGNGAGITMYGDDHLVHGSRIANNNLGMGIYASGERLSFQYNEFENNGLPPPDVFVHSLYISSCDGVLFEHNEVHSATDGVKVRRSHNGVYRYNTFHHMNAIGIHLGGDSEGGSRNNRIESNLFHDNASDIVIKSESGVQVELLDGLVIANNIMLRGTDDFVDYGSHLTVTDLPARDVAVVNNLVFETTLDNGIHIDNSGSGLRCMNNVVGHFGGGSFFTLSGGVSASNNLELSSRGAFDGLALADPDAMDFGITAGSAALIDTGADVSDVLTTDYAGGARPVGGAFDIGPFEHRP